MGSLTAILISHSSITTGLNLIKNLNTNEAYRISHLFRKAQHVKLDNWEKKKKKKKKKKKTDFFFLKSENTVKLWIKTDTSISFTDVWGLFVLIVKSIG